MFWKVKSLKGTVAINSTSALFFFISGWKLNPVVSAVYSPEFYAGRKTCPSPSVTISFAVIFLPLIRFVLRLLWHLHFFPSPCSPLSSFFTVTFITSTFPFSCKHATRQSLFIAPKSSAESHECWQQSVISAENWMDFASANATYESARILAIPVLTSRKFYPLQMSLLVITMDLELVKKNFSGKMNRRS